MMQRSEGMKDLFEGKTKKEIAALTDEQVSQYVNMGLAEAGIPLTASPPKEAFADYIKKTERAWEINGIALLFSSIESANAVRDVIRANAENIVTEGYDWRLGYDLKWIKPREVLEFEVSEKSFYSEAIINKNTDVLTKIKAAKDSYEGEKKLCDKVSEERAKIADWVWTTRYEAVNFVEKVDRLKNSYQEYVALDKENAPKFFIKAWKERVDPDVWAAVSLELGFLEIQETKHETNPTNP